MQKQVSYQRISSTIRINEDDKNNTTRGCIMNTQLEWRGCETNYYYS